ncbi:MAG: hypothetical protein E6K35_14145 [Gammaproteobacteria bacterium]|nr:MAG: hypothetical protein E6K47_10755 [Gammaproteobacteria bacterium]TLY84808.1 MAG: hypothetical protein E6K35_14145 [Gammaproteobacteria bacterium]
MMTSTPRGARFARPAFVRPLAAQLWYGINAIVSNPPAALIAYRAACGEGGDCADARRLLREFDASGTF